MVQAEAQQTTEVQGQHTGRKIFSWALWDWGSAAFNAVATTFVFTVYLTADGMFTDKETANSYLAIGMTLAGLVIALFAPVTGRRADKAGKGLRSIGLFSTLVVLCMAAMYFVAPDSSLGKQNALILGVFLLGLGSIFFEFASVNYNAMLNYISTKDNRGRISGLGWGLGYLGGIVLLLVLYFGLIDPEVGWFGITSENGLDVRVSMLIAAVWLLLFSLPVLFDPPNNYVKQGNLAAGSLLDNYKDLFRSIGNLAKQAPDTLRFLVASAIFRDGLAGVFTFGGVIAASVFGFSNSEVILFAIAANVVAGISTVIVGAIDDRVGPKLVIVFSLVSMIVAALGVFFLHANGTMVFWTLGLALCVFVGPAQSASRSLLARMIPAGREGEIFGLYATTGRAVSFLAPASYAVAIWIGGLITGGTDATYWGILGIVAVLLVGLILLALVKPDRVRITD